MFVCSHLHIGSSCLETLLLSGDQSKLVKLYSADHGWQLSSGGSGGDQLVQCQVCSELCLGAMGYMMHMDHHLVNSDLECPKCKRYGFPTICQFYNHSCARPETKYCASCDEMRVLEGWTLSPVTIDTMSLGSRAADLAQLVRCSTLDNEVVVSKHLQELDDEEVDLVFHNSFNLQLGTASYEKMPTLASVSSLSKPVVDLTDL